MIDRLIRWNDIDLYGLAVGDAPAVAASEQRPRHPMRVSPWKEPSAHRAGRPVPPRHCYLITLRNIYQCHVFISPFFLLDSKPNSPTPLLRSCGRDHSCAQKKRYEDEPKRLAASVFCSIKSVPGGSVSWTPSFTMSSDFVGSRSAFAPRDLE